MLLVGIPAPTGNPSRVVWIVGVVVECVWWRRRMLRLVVFVQSSHSSPLPAAATAASFDRNASPSIGRMLLLVLRMEVLLVGQMRRNHLVGR